MAYIHTIYNTKSKQSIKFACLKHILGIRLLYNYSSLKNQNTFYIFTILAIAATKFFYEIINNIYEIQNIAFYRYYG